jgi:hypothetical protein
MLPKIKVFQEVTSYRLVNSYLSLEKSQRLHLPRQTIQEKSSKSEVSGQLGSEG